MKRDEIKVGTAYAVSDRTDYGSSANRAFITGPAQVVDVPTRGSYRGTHPETRFRATVSYPGGDREEFLPTRKIKEPWDSYFERVQAGKAARAERQRAEAQAQDDRARLLLDLIPAMRHYRIPETTAMIHTARVRELLALHCPDLFIIGEDGEPTKEIVAPLARSIGDYVFYGKMLHISAANLLEALR